MTPRRDDDRFLVVCIIGVGFIVESYSFLPSLSFSFDFLFTVVVMMVKSLSVSWFGRGLYDDAQLSWSVVISSSLLVVWAVVVGMTPSSSSSGLSTAWSGNRPGRHDAILFKRTMVEGRTTSVPLAMVVPTR